MEYRAERMVAATYDRYGSPDVVDVKEVAAAKPDAKRPVIVEVHTAALNPFDVHLLSGTPYLVRISGGLRTPKRHVTGVDFAGTVVHVEPDVDGVAVGDEVFGVSDGACAEFMAVSVAELAQKPAGYSFAEAATCGVAGLTALQGLVEKGGLEPGNRVLINGASGGVGTFAVQIAHALGADVTAVCSARNAELVGSLGADRVVDYTTGDFLEIDTKYDIILDNMGNRAPAACRRILSPRGRYVLVSGPKDRRVLGPVGHMARAVAAFAFRSQTAKPFIADATAEGLSTLRDQLERLHVQPVIDRSYPLAEVADALNYVAEGHARGKVLIAVGA